MGTIAGLLFEFLWKHLTGVSFLKISLEIAKTFASSLARQDAIPDGYLEGNPPKRTGWQTDTGKYPQGRKYSI
jgi:hypothetical protein